MNTMETKSSGALRFSGLLLALLSCALVSCAPGSGEGLDQNGRPLGESGATGPLIAEFGAIQANVLTPSCATSGCHSGAAAPQGLRLDAASSYALLVGIESNQVPALLRVAPGDPNNSYLIQKLEGTAAVGGRMPLNGPPFLDQAAVDVIRQWISDGALPPTSEGAQAPQVVSISPADATSVDELPAEISVIFTQDMDATLLSNDTVTIRRSGGDATFGDGDDIIIQPAELALDAANPRIVRISLAGVASQADDYQIRLVGTGANALASVAGEILDGNGDGTAGGDFVSVFTVAEVTASLQSIQDTIFTPTCATSGCHEGPIGSGLPAGQDLSSVGNSYASLVNIPSVQQPNLLRVNPGNANDSYLIQKLEGTAASGAQMPLGGSLLSQSSIDTIRAWINAGASSGGADATLPAVSITSPGDGDIVAGQITVTASASDNVGVTEVDFLINSVSIGSDATSPFEITWDTTTVADDRYVLVARATDAAGNSADSEIVRLDVDNAGCSNDPNPPTVELTAPAAGTVSGTVTVSANAADNVGVTRVSFFANGELIESDTTSPYSISWDTTAFPNGEVTVTADATDGCNTTTSAPVTVTLDNSVSGFVVTSLSPRSGALEFDFPSSIVVNFSASLNGSTVNATTFVLERSGGDGTFGDGNEAQFNAPVVANGTQASMDLSEVLPSFEDTYRVTLSETIVDQAGNMLDGDGDGTPGGDFVASFTTDLTTYTADAQPIFQNKCNNCHTGEGDGGHNIGTVYSHALRAADDNACNGLTVGQCTIVLIQAGDMPQDAGCSGDPAQDAGNGSCLTQAEQATIQAWIDDRLPN